MEAPFFPKDYASHEAHVIKTASQFMACSFLGRAKYDKREATTLAAAEQHARDMIAERSPTDIFNKGRPVLVYAIAGVHQVVAATVKP